MPEYTETSLEQIQQLYNRVNEYQRKNLAAIRAEAAAASDAVSGSEQQRHREILRQLKLDRVELTRQHAQVFTLERTYEDSHRERSDAEHRLAEGVRSANGLVRSINGIADTLNKVAEFAGIITRLIGVFT